MILFDNYLFNYFSVSSKINFHEIGIKCFMVFHLILWEGGHQYCNGKGKSIGKFLINFKKRKKREQKFFN